MADEEIKKPTPKKRTTTSKPKVEEQPKTDPMVEQMQQMMAMMMAQQQQLMELMAKTQQLEEQKDDEEEEEQYKPKKPRKKRQDDKMNKQQLRRKYKDVDIYIINVSQGMVIYHGKNNRYEWQNPGDIEVVAIEDIINMPRSYLHTPWVALDAYENEDELIEDIISVLGLHPIYEYIYTLQAMEEDINEVDLEDIKNAIILSKKHGYDITMDMAVLVQRKIRENVLTNYHTIAELSKLLGRKFL